MAKSTPTLPRRSVPIPPRIRVDGVHKKQGRPPWSAQLQRKMVWLYLFSDMTNAMMSDTLGETAGVRTMQNYRKALLSDPDDSWRPRDRSHMCQRLARMHKYAQSVFYRHDETPCLEGQGHENPGPDSNGRPVSRTESFSFASSPMITITRAKSSEIEHHLSDPPVVLMIKTARGQQQRHRCLYSQLPSKLVEQLGPARAARTSDDFSGLSIYIHSIRLRHVHIEARRSLAAQVRDLTQRLAINACQLRAFSAPRLKGFANLRYLSLRRNLLSELHELPRSLEILDISENTFNLLPDELCRLKNLRILHVSHNLLRRLPPWLSELTSLKVIVVDNNPFEADIYSLVDFARTFCSYGCLQDQSSFCKTAFTSLLMRLLRQQSGEYSSVSTASPGCSCMDREQQSPDVPIVTLATAYPGSTDVLRAQDQFGWVDPFCTSSILPASGRSSRSAMTFDSMMSARDSVASLRPRMSWQDLMLVHCCTKKMHPSRDECLHRKLIKWHWGEGTGSSPPADILASRDLGDNTALHFAALLEAPVTAIISLIENGCDPTQTNTRGETFLHLVHPRFWQATRRELVQLIHVLRARQFPFTQRDIQGNTFLHNTTIANSEVNISVAEYWWQFQHMRNSTGHLPWQPHDILHQDKLAPDGWLFACHARIGTSQRRDTAVVIPCAVAAKEKNREGIFCACCDQQATSLHQLALALYRDYRKFELHGKAFREHNPSEMLVHLLGHSPDVNAYDHAGRTVLMAFIRGLCHRWPRHSDRNFNLAYVQRCVDILLGAGADVHRRDRQGNTALYYAVNYCAPGVVRRLILAGASVNILNDRGVSILRLWTEKRSNYGRCVKVHAHATQCLTVLLDHEAELEPAAHWQWMSATVGLLE